MKDFKEFYRLYSKELYNYLFYLTNDRTLAEELVQETFYHTFKSIHRFKGDSKIKTWLYQIGKNVYYKYLKMNSPNNDVFDENDGNFVNISTPENILQKEEQDRALHQAIQQLKEPYKQVVILRSFNELSFKDIGEVFLEKQTQAKDHFKEGE
ncbi:RNA polymerase sigma factor [Peribacillus frigoritolerans]|uniref:RNA polymerase sigma factor n=1 Tax=Peribacillus frigoritolerans TaxID=450367 RepID=UPI002E1B8015|nr:sigma-70 family RNA polymerase sigma factor [Peribacillus frigoritolerans]MED3849413.1 sigma-70 family RNA polymerase sigma factor [Peribacillus frigoritolerans]